MFGNPVSKLDDQLTAGWISMTMPSPLSPEDKLNRIVNIIHQAAQTVSAKRGREVAVATINAARRPEETDDRGDLWRKMLDAVIENL